jgi:choline dehydrogenase-like flavoprotein
MNLFQVIRSPKVYDVCIVGSGAAGGAAAKVLTERGFDVVLLEAGPMLDVSKHYTEHTWTYNLPHRGYGVGGSGYNRDGNRELDVAHIGGRIKGEPYTSAPDSPFSWTRARILGGRTNHWSRVALRFSEVDFRTRSLTGSGADWPITYQELAPYYDKVESFIGVYGTRENIASSPDGIFQPPPNPRCSDLMVKRGCDRMGIPCIPGRAAILTQPHNGRPACRYCGQCTQGCGAASTFSSSQVIIPQAMATGRLKVIANAMARELLVDSEGKLSAVSYIDKLERSEKQVRAKAFLLGASTCQSARLLLNSRSSKYPNGLANSSGAVGRYLMDSSSTTVIGYFPQLSKLPPHNDEGTASVHMYIPWWKDSHRNKYPGTYHVELLNGRHMPGPNAFRVIAREFEGYGPELKRKCRESFGAIATLAVRGSMVPNERSYCEIDSEVVDQWGIPVLRFHFKWNEEEIRLAEDANQTCKAIVEAAGGKVIAESGSPHDRYGHLGSGGVAHEVGAVRMGSDAKTSVLNGFCQAHDVSNLFVTDAACFTTNPNKNPTLSILALSWRAAEHLADEAKKGNL